jgi:hypothetical protein
VAALERVEVDIEVMFGAGIEIGRDEVIADMMLVDSVTRSNFQKVVGPGFADPAAGRRIGV